MKQIKNIILKFVNKPQGGVLSSQTLYETAFYLLNLNVIDNELYAKRSLELVIKKIVDTQLPDGGFDLGYDFIFGKGLHKKHDKEGTSPELLSVSALARYYKEVEKSAEVLGAINKGVDWIFDRTIETKNGYAIPYAPDSYDKIHITNATSFTVGALASVINILEGDRQNKAKLYLVGMYNFMNEQLEISGSSGYWPYFYQKGTESELALVNDKVDNYHMAQQLYHHILAEQELPNSGNEGLIHSVYTYLSGQVKADGFVPYTINSKGASDKVSVWGYSSLISAFSLYSKIYDVDEARTLATNVKGYLFKYCWNGHHFSPVILNSSKAIFDNNFYPRSDAWVLHSISDYSRYVEVDEPSLQCSDIVLNKILANDFSGLENHTITARKKLFATIVGLLRG